MDKFGKTLIFALGLFVMFIGLHMALKVASPHIAKVAPELARMLQS